MTAPRRTGEDEGEAGFVLPSVLLAAALFVAVSASFALRARLLTLQAANLTEAARFQAEIDGAALFAADALRSPESAAPDEAALIAAALSGRRPGETARSDLPLPVDGTPVACPMPDGGRLALAAVDQAALLDLNGASVPMLRDFIAATGIDGITARRLADEIGDFRDSDDDPQENGIGERAQYAARGLAWGPANRPFADAEEIARLPSATPDLVERLRPLFTTANPRAGLDLALTPSASAGLLSPEGVGEPALARWSLASARTDFSVEARLYRADGSLAAGRRVLVAFGGAAGGTMRIVRWSRLPPDGGQARAASADENFCPPLLAALGIGGAARR